MTVDETETPVERPRLFISHSSEDKPFVNRLVARLDGLGLKRPWYDVFELGPTTADISESLKSGISEAAFFCLVLSRRSVNSQWVSLEISHAIQRDTPTLVALHDAPNGPGPFLLTNPFVNKLLRGGQRMVIDFGDFDSGSQNCYAPLRPSSARRSRWSDDSSRFSKAPTPMTRNAR